MDFSEVYEKLGLFYLGSEIDLETKEQTEDLLLVKNKNLTTHAAIIGMTGSGKTGLGISMIEEAVLDKIPSIIIDPKGDMGNLLLAFDDFDPKKFEPWIDEGEAEKKFDNHPDDFNVIVKNTAGDVVAKYKMQKNKNKFIAILPPGNYNLIISHNGFKDIAKKISITEDDKMIEEKIIIEKS